MSQTTSIGVVGPSYWLYMAAVMAEYLEKVVAEAKVSGDIPRGVYNDVLEFFNLVLQAAGNNIPTNPPASINAYTIAADAVRGSAQPTPKTQNELEKYLGQYSDFIKSMQQPRILSGEEIETAKVLRKFFLRLQQEGEAEACTSNTHFDAPPAGLRLY